MHKIKLYIYILFPILFTSFIISEISAQPPSIVGNTSEVSKYEVNQTKLRLYYDRRDDGGETGWYTTHEGDAKLNIADANAGSVVGSFFSSSIPSGHISRVEKTISGYFVIKAVVNLGGTLYYSTSNNAAASTNSGDYEEAIIPFMGEGGVPTDSFTDEETADVTVAENSRITFRLTFNLLSDNGDGTSGCVGLIAGSDVGRPEVAYVIGPRQPNVTKEIVSE